MSMRKTVALLMLLGFALASPDFGRWYPFAEAQALAQAHGRLLLVYFHSPACPYCDQMNTFVLSDPQVDALLRGRYVVASVSTATPEGQDLARRFRVPGVPQLCLPRLPQGGVGGGGPAFWQPAPGAVPGGAAPGVRQRRCV
jgi:thioredoxin-related protein